VVEEEGVACWRRLLLIVLVDGVTKADTDRMLIVNASSATSNCDGDDIIPLIVSTPNVISIIVLIEMIDQVEVFQFLSFPSFICDVPPTTINQCGI